MKYKVSKYFPLIKSQGLLFVLFVVLQINSAYADQFANLASKIIHKSIVTTTQFQLADNSSGGTQFIDDSSTENWTMEGEHQIILIPFDGLMIPIETKKPAVILSHEDRGRFVFKEGVMRSATRTPVVKVPATSISYNYRPTLFITIPGPEISSSGGFSRGTQAWQHSAQEVISQLAVNSNPRHSQYMHFAVDWDSDETNRSQVEDIGGLVKDFLRNRIDAWDVVVIGHSRGGIFAHDLTKELVGFNKIKNIHTFLLDPTAAVPMGDLYPLNLHTSSWTTEYGSLFYDGELFNFNGVFSGLFTQSDYPINGYNNYNLGSSDVLFDSTHEAFGNNWVSGTNVGLSRALDDVWARKDIGTFMPDGDSRYEIIRVSAAAIIIDANISISDGNLNIDGIIKIGDIQASLNAMMGTDGIDVSATVLLISAQVVIRDNQAVVVADVGVGSFRTDISSSGIDVQVDVLDVGADLNVGSGGISVSGNVGDVVSASISLTSGVSISIGGFSFGF